MFHAEYAEVAAQPGPITLTSPGIIKYHLEVMLGFALRVWAEMCDLCQLRLQIAAWETSRFNMFQWHAGMPPVSVAL